MILEFSDDESTWRREFIVCLPGAISEATMLDRACARPGSYAGRLVVSLHRAIFDRSLDLLADYSRYFAKEYRSFDEYLSKRLMFSHEVREAIAGASDAKIALHCKLDFAFLQDESGRNYLTELLEPKEAK